MKKTNEEFNFTVEVGRDRPSTKYSGLFGSGESHGHPAEYDPSPAVIALGIAVFLLLAVIAIAFFAASVQPHNYHGAASVGVYR